MPQGVNVQASAELAADPSNSIIATAAHAREYIDDVEGRVPTSERAELMYPIKIKEATSVQKLKFAERL